MSMNKRILNVVALIATFLAAAPAAADDGQALSLWQVAGQQNRVYLLGSIHLLRREDHPLPPAIYAAYEDADKIIMELDMDDVDPVASQVLTNELGLISDGRTLRDLMGEELYTQAISLAETARIPLSLLDKSEPWFAAMNVEIMMLMRIGFDPALGIENQLMERARADDKEILGFETMRQQLEFLDGLSPSAQREMLIQALSEGSEMQQTMDEMILAWRTGDVQFLEDNLLADMADYPELHKVIVVDRNVAWTDEIEELLDESDDYLIVVGALHLVGQEGVPRLLQARGHDVIQLRQAAH
jgi:uncharacterized protein YbaP (TraB family)